MRRRFFLGPKTKELTPDEETVEVLEVIENYDDYSDLDDDDYDELIPYTAEY